MVVKPTNVPMQPDHGDVKDVVHQVVVDGRFIDEFATNPNAVTNHLGITVAKETKAKMVTHTSTADTYGVLQHKAATVPQVGVIVGIVIVAVVVWVLVDPPVVHSKDVMATKPVNDPLEHEKD
jgi:hypothetical protein